MNPHITPTVRAFLPNAANLKHFEAVSQFYLIDSLNDLCGGFKASVFAIHPINPLELGVTKAFPLPLLPIDQSSIEGNLHIIETVMKDILKLPSHWFDDKDIIVAGDQLTVSRVKSVMELRKPDLTRFDRMEWAVPMFQLFHLQMILCKTIVATHMGESDKPGSLGFSIARLGRKRVDIEKAEYHASHEIVKHTFHAMVRRLWEVELKQRPDAFVHGLKADEEMDVISKRAKDIYQRYFTDSEKVASDYGNTDANAALFLRDTTVYLELCAAIKAGDIGRIEEVLKLITVMFQAGGTKNYAGELMRLAYAIHHVWSKRTKETMLSSWLVNIKGARNSWHPADLYQEHNNKLIKNCVRKVCSERDIGKILRGLETHGVFSREKNDSYVEPSVDLVKVGMHNLVSKRFELFIQNLKEESEIENDPVDIDDFASDFQDSEIDE
ncbi:hypothetical protein BGX20_004692 [Mortierella sp. AD010]|nr:hypothetical protein BGX20_004692 [Mortierella sp. AD010]